MSTHVSSLSSSVFITEDGLFSLTIDISAQDYLCEIVESPYLRLSIKKGGCSGSMYAQSESSSWDPESDYRFLLSPNFSLIVPKKEAQDQLKSLFCHGFKNTGGFIIRWSHKTTGAVCGCGESFS